MTKLPPRDDSDDQQHELPPPDVLAGLQKIAEGMQRQQRRAEARYQAQRRQSRHGAKRSTTPPPHHGAPAICRPEPDGGFAYLCPGCCARLGFAHPTTPVRAQGVDLTVLQAAKITELYGDPLGTWVLTYRGRVYLRQRDGTYSMQRKSRVQRSRRPASPALLSTNGELNGGYEVVGEFPSLPTVVRCPGCNLRAYIGVPGG